jgi:hypothetical protein
VVIKTVSGKDFEPYLLRLANLRIKIFREYPYLYDGNIEDEKQYLVYTLSVQRVSFF